VGGDVLQESCRAGGACVSGARGGRYEREGPTVADLGLRPFSFDEVIRAVDAVLERLGRATGALRAGGVPYAVIGGNAVALWVARVDRAAVRNTQDVDIMIRRADFDAARRALEDAGFVYRHVKGIDMFLDGPGAKARDAVHIVYAGEKVRPADPVAAPDVAEGEEATEFRVMALEALVRMKLTSYRDKDRAHIRDMLDVGLIDATWPDRLPPALADRLRQILDTPEG
jgi:hypothetical protein